MPKLQFRSETAHFDFTLVITTKTVKGHSYVTDNMTPLNDLGNAVRDELLVQDKKVEEHFAHKH